MKNKNINSNKIICNFIWRFGERISAQIVTFIVSIVLARLLSPEDYGTITIVTVFITIANVFVTSGFGNSLIQKKYVDNKDFSSVFYFNIVFSSILYIALFYLAPYIEQFYNIPTLSTVIRVLGLRIIIAGINSVQQAYVSRNMLFKKFFLSTLLGTILSGVIGLVMAYNGFGVWALVAQYLSSTIIDTIVLWITVKWRPELIFSLIRMKDMFSYGWKLLCSSLLDTGYSQLRGLVIGKMYSSTDLAFYDRGQQYPSLVITNINTSIGSVLFPVMSKNQDNKLAIKNMTRKAIRTSSYIMWPMMIGLGVVAEPLISIMLTDKWLPCVPFLQISCFTYGFWPIHTANLEAIKAIGRSDIFLRLEIIKKTIGICVLIISMKYGVIAIALTGVITTLTSSFINAYPNSRLLNYKYIEQIKDIAPSILLSIIMGLCIYPIKYFINNKILLIFAQVVIGTSIYLITSMIVKFEVFENLIDMIKLIKQKK